MSDTIDLIPAYGDDMGKIINYPDTEEVQLCIVRQELFRPEDWNPADNIDTVPAIPMSPTFGDSAGDTIMYPEDKDTYLAYARGELDTIVGGTYQPPPGGEETPGDTTGGGETLAGGGDSIVGG